MTDTAAIEALWFNAGTAHELAAAMNLHRGAAEHLTARRIKKIWRRARRAGRLPNFVRPVTGFAPGPSVILRRFMMIERAA